MKTGRGSTVRTRTCRLGPTGVELTWQDGRLHGVEFVKPPKKDDPALRRSLRAVLAGKPVPPELQPYAGKLPQFTSRVLGICAAIKPGRVMTYAELARAAGRPGAARAAGQVMARNRFAILIPCHRVVASDYRLQGFRGGLDMKEFLLRAEGWQVEGKGRSRRLVQA